LHLQTVMLERELQLQAGIACSSFAAACRLLCLDNFLHQFIYVWPAELWSRMLSKLPRKVDYSLPHVVLRAMPEIGTVSCAEPSTPLLLDSPQFARGSRAALLEAPHSSPLNPSGYISFSDVCLGALRAPSTF
jgi:hypothetical protein